MDLLDVSETKPDTQASKRRKRLCGRCVLHSEGLELNCRKVIEKTVVKVKIPATASAGNLKNEGLPYDFWSWRKYGQKPIKGSPFPRGYYKCSTSKGCSAKKQVERCRTDASLLIITYTSSHNHPGPTLPVKKLDQNENTRLTWKTPGRDDVQEEEEISTSQLVHPSETSKPTTPKQVQHPQEEDQNQSKTMINQMEEDPFEEASGKDKEETMTLSSTSKLSEENDFFDELEELPISSDFASFKRTTLFDEIRIPIVPS